VGVLSDTTNIIVTEEQLELIAALLHKYLLQETKAITSIVPTVDPAKRLDNIQEQITKLTRVEIFYSNLISKLNEE
jgi:hypothetical protein